MNKGIKMSPSLNLYDLLNNEESQQLFVGRLYIHKLTKRSSRILLSRYQYDLLFISFKCTIESRQGLLIDVHNNRNDLETIFQIVVLSFVYCFNPLETLDDLKKGKDEKENSEELDSEKVRELYEELLIEDVKLLPIWKEIKIWEQIFVYDCEENTKSIGNFESAKLAFNKVIKKTDKDYNSGFPLYKDVYKPEVISKSFLDMQKFMFQLELSFEFISKTLKSIGQR